ncbi:MAG TPA: N-acetylmuramoyl-L-alanine amidase CwlD [Bacillales bacterium]|nr:N-acetylmuramoyl-L-alanine amidase CwlD [Bacillales bacterium]
MTEDAEQIGVKPVWGESVLKAWWKKALFIMGALLLLFIFQYEMNTNDTGGSWQTPLAGKVIVLDPGHGGPDGGAVGKGPVVEKDISLAISHDLKHYLQQAGALVLMTREKDQDLADEDTKGLSRRKTQDLHRRVEFVNQTDPNIVVSIHLNAIPSPRWNGAQTFFDPHVEESQHLAKFIQDSLRFHLENTTRFAKAINTVYLLKTVDVPAALVEVGFLSNPEEKDLLKTEPYQKSVAASIYQGILRYYGGEPVPEQ